MKIYNKINVAAVAVVIFVLGAFAVELPVKKIGGKDCYCYTAKKGETAMGIAKTLGIPYSEVINANQWAQDGVRPGQTLYFPVADFKGRLNSGHADREDQMPQYHIVDKNETVYGVSKHYGIPADTLVALNPWASSGLKAGQRLLLPAGTRAQVSEIGLTDNEPNGTVTESGDTAMADSPTAPSAMRLGGEDITVGADLTLTPVDAEVTTINTETAAPVNDAGPAVADTPQYVGVVLPFNLGDETLSRQANIVTEFYRGVLIAVDTLAHQSAPLVVRTLDSGTGTAALKNQLASDTVLTKVSAIIASPDAQQFAEIADWSAQRGIYVVNSYLVKDSTYLTNPYVIQTYIPQDLMYEKATDYLLNLLGQSDFEYVPVILRNTTGKNDKAAFVELLTGKLTTQGKEFVTLEHDGTLTVDELEEGLTPEKNYIIIPTSGSLNDFNKFSTALAKYIDGVAMPRGERIVTFGFPEWTAFRGRARDELAKIYAQVYSRSYADENTMAYKGIDEAFKRWYGRGLTPEVPVQGIQGFDVMELIVGTLRGGGFDMPQRFNGVQSSFYLKRVPGGGFVNEALYIVDFLPGGSVNVEVI